MQPPKPSFQLRRREVLTGGALTLAAAASGHAAVQSTADPRQSTPAGRLRVAYIVDEGVNMIDLAGAWEVFQDTRADPERKKDKAFFLYAVGPERKVYYTTGNGGNLSPGMPAGLPFTPNYTFADAPVPDLIVMGAQGVSPSTPEKLGWIQRHAEQAKVVMSVCTGAFLLAKTGLLDGKQATTHHEYFDSFAEQFPKVELLRGRRFVDNGKFVSAGGLTSGIDGALHVVSRLVGQEQAAATAAYMEYSGDGWKRGGAIS